MNRRIYLSLRRSVSIVLCLTLVIAFFDPEAEARCVVVTFELDYYQMIDLTGTHDDTTTPNSQLTVQLCEDQMTQSSSTKYSFVTGSQFDTDLDMPEVPDKVASETPTGYSKMAIQIAIEEDEDTECSFAARTTYFTSWNPYSDECSSCIESWSFSHDNNLSIEKTIDVSTSAPSDIIIYLCDFFKSRMEEQNQYIGSLLSG